MTERVARIEVYPGSYRRVIQEGEITTVFDDQALGHLTRFALHDVVTKPAEAHDFVHRLTPDIAMPGVNHYGSTRAYLLHNDSGESCVIKVFPDNCRRSSGLEHLATQELLRNALRNTTGYDAARVYGYISMSSTSGSGYAIVEYIDAAHLREVEGPINYTNPVTHAITRAITYLRHHQRRQKMIPEGTCLRDYYDLRDNLRANVTQALHEYGVDIPRLTSEGFGNWDFNTSNLLCTADTDGRAQLTLIDQAAELPVRFP